MACYIHSTQKNNPDSAAEPLIHLPEASNACRMMKTPIAWIAVTLGGSSEYRNLIGWSAIREHDWLIGKNCQMALRSGYYITSDTFSIGVDTVLCILVISLSLAFEYFWLLLDDEGVRIWQEFLILSFMMLPILNFNQMMKKQIWTQRLM